MGEIKIIDIKKDILSENKDQATLIRKELALKKVYMVNVMASPGAGKTSLIIETIKHLKGYLRIAVVEGDIESIVDSEKIIAQGVPAVQIRTGGACHLDAPMVSAALDQLDLDLYDLLFVENIGNLVCPAEFDIGSDLQVMLLSIPEGDDKILKYPLMFSVCDVLLINKLDYMGMSDFNLELLHQRAKELNPGIRILEISCKTGIGLEEWITWLLRKVQSKIVVL